MYLYKFFPVQFFCFYGTHNDLVSTQVPCPIEYRIWLRSMYTLSGKKWLNMHSGPMWKVETTDVKGPTSLPKSQVIQDVRWSYMDVPMHTNLILIYQCCIVTPNVEINRQISCKQKNVDGSIVNVYVTSGGQLLTWTPLTLM